MLIRYRVIGALLVAAAGFFSACTKPDGPAPAGKAEGTASGPAESIQKIPGSWLTDEPGVRVSRVGRAADGSLEMDVQLAGGAAAPSRTVAVNLVLPEGARAVLHEYRVGEDGFIYRAGDAQLGTTAALQQASGGARGFPLRSMGTVREWPIWRLEVPQNFWGGVRSNAHGNEGATLTIRFEGTGGDVGGDARAEGAMADFVRRLVANADDIDRWRVRPEIRKEIADAPTGPRQLSPNATHWARLTVGEDGPVRVTPAALAGAGFPESAAQMNELRIFANGKSVPARVAQIGGEPNLIFYGWRSVSPYDSSQVYWIAYEPGAAPERFEVAEAAGGAAKNLETIRRIDRIERDQALMIHLGEFLDIKKVRWIDTPLMLSQPLRVGFDLFQPVAGEGEHGVDLNVTLVTAEPSRVKNVLQPAVGFLLQRPAELLLTADDPTTNPASLDADLIHARLPLQMAEEIKINHRLPVALFQDGPTTVDLRLAIQGEVAGLDEAGQALWLDAVEVGYRSAARPRKGRLTLALDNVTTTGAYRVATGDWGIDPANLMAFSLNAGERKAVQVQLENAAATLSITPELRGEIVEMSAMPLAELEPFAVSHTVLNYSDEKCDQLLITNRVFREELKPLLELKASQGLKTRVVDIDDLYLNFSGGMLSPEAIRRYLANWLRTSPETAPGSVLLVGDASSDFLHLTRSDVPNLVPSSSGMSAGESWACDYWFTCVAGEDFLGDFQIGRLSAEKLDDMREVIGKTMRYASTPVGPWRARIGTIADNYLTPTDNFREIAEHVRTLETPPGYADWRLYLDDLPLEDDWYVPQIVFMQEYEERKEWRKTSGVATNAIRNRLNEGTSVLSFYGHGSPNLWTTERIWLGMDSPNRDSQYLKSDGKYAFVVNYTCNSGAIDYPMRPYNLCLTEDLLRAKDGGAVALFVPSGEGMNEDQRVFGREVQRALFADESRRFGELTLLARLRYLLGGNPVYLGYMYNLLGDPAAELQLASRGYELALERDAVRPGMNEVTARLQNPELKAGKSIAWLEDQDGALLWQSAERAFSGGSVEWTVPIPKNIARPDTMNISVYGWNESEVRDFLATARLDYRIPRPVIERAAGRREGDLVVVDILIKNPEKIETDELSLDILNDAREVLASQKISLAAGEQKELHFRVPGGEAGRPAVFEARIPAVGGGQTHENVDVVRAFAVTPAASWTGIAAGLSSWERQQTSAAGTISIVALTSGTRQPGLDTLVARDGVRMITSTTLAFAPAPAGGQIATVRWAGEALGLKQADFTARDSAIRFDFEHRETTASQQAEIVDSVSLAQLPRRSPRLRIVRESVKVEPERPTDGETIFVRFRAENAGDMESSAFTPRLLSGDPTTTRTVPLNVVSKLPPKTYGPLGPGRAVDVSLRWDPIQNQGKQTIWIELNPAAPPSADARKEQLASHTFYVLSKSNLGFKRPVWATFDGADRESDRRVLHAEVENTGETDARAVEVTFYRSRDKRPEDVLDVAFIPLLAAKSSKEVTYVWEGFDPNSHPSADLRLRGSQQRIHD